MKALVTGGAGFIGSNLVDALLERGDEVTVRRRPLHRQAGEPRGRARRTARRSRRSTSGRRRRWRRWSGATSPDVIFHLAAQIDVRKSVADPANDARINVEGTHQRARAPRRRTAFGRVVNTSTGGAIYGEGKQLPAPEDHPSAPEAPYGLSKWCAEQYCEIFNRLHGLSTVSLRYGNVYGPRQDPLGEAGVIAIFCGKLLEGGTGHDLRRRQADARLRLRGRRGGREPARRRVGRHRPDQHRPRPGEVGARHRRGAEGSTRPTASTSSTPPSAPARCSTSRSTPRARVKSSAGRPRSSSTRA